MTTLAHFIKSKRKEVQLTQEEFAERTGVALTVIRKIEQGKTNLQLDKVNLVLKMFGHELTIQRIDSFKPATLETVFGKLFDDGLITQDELHALSSEFAHHYPFNSTGVFENNRAKRIRMEIENMLYKNQLGAPYLKDYLV